MLVKIIGDGTSCAKTWCSNEGRSLTDPKDHSKINPKIP
jgi:hypothetical protein